MTKNSDKPSFSKIVIGIAVVLVIAKILFEPLLMGFGMLVLYVYICSGITYDVTVTAGKGGMVIGESGSYHSGERLEFSAVPDSGYMFVSWSDGEKDNPRGILVFEDYGDVNIQAIFTKISAFNNGIDSKIEDIDVSLIKSKTSLKYVDLGLPSGTLWGACNIGASSPEQIGDYFAWGETTPHYAGIDSLGVPAWCTDYFEGYCRSTYRYCKKTGTLVRYLDNPEYSYTDTLSLSTLELNDDAAYVILGEEWKMPTIEQWIELTTKCYWAWTNGYNGTSVEGFIVYKPKNEEDEWKYTGKNNKFDIYKPVASYKLSDKHIFLPVSGFYTNAEHEGRDNGYYWSSVLNDAYWGYGLVFDSRGPKYDHFPPHLGLLIRPVRR